MEAFIIVLMMTKMRKISQMMGINILIKANCTKVHVRKAESKGL